MSGRSAWSIDRGRAGISACLILCSFALPFLADVFLPRVLDTANSRAADVLFKARYRLKGKGEVSPYLVHVVVTDSTRQTLGLSAWDRQAFGRALEVLHRLGARTVACDVFFKDPTFQDNDAALLAAAARSRSVVFPLLAFPDGPLNPEAASAASAEPAEILDRTVIHPKVLKEGSAPTAAHLMLPFAALAGAAGALGHINCEPDGDGRNRRLPLVYRHGNGFIVSLSLRAALEFLEVDPGNVEISFGRQILLRGARRPDGLRRDIAIPIDAGGRLIVNHVGPWEDSFLTVTLQTLLSADRDGGARSGLRDLIDGALVVISDVSTANRDYGPGIFENVYPLGGLHVSAANSILTGSFLSREGMGASLLTALGLALALWLATVAPKGFVFPVFLTGLYAAYLASCYWLFAGLQRVPPVASMTAGFVLALVSVAAYRLVLAGRERSAFLARLEADRALEALNSRLVDQTKELQRANEKLKEMDQFKANFVQNVAHELRTPLALILDPLEALQRTAGESLPQSVLQHIEQMQRNARRLLQLVNQFLDVLPWARERFRPEEIEPGYQRDGEIPARAGGRNASSIVTADRANPDEPVLVVDDKPEVLNSSARILKENGIGNLTTCSDGDLVLQILRDRQVSAVVLDFDMPGVSGTTLLSQIKEEFPSLQVLVITGVKDADVAVECIKLGAFDYLVKPVERSRLVRAVQRSVEKGRLEREVDVLSRRLHSLELRNPDAFSEIVTASRLMLSKLRYVEAIAGDTDPVLITGESGVGKELVARAIHRLSGRQGSFVCENVAGLDDTMLADTLFGHRKGAFTDAQGVRKGLVEEAAGGTLFLDEIGDMSVNSQVKLRFIEEKEYRPLGSDSVKVSDARVVIATNVDLARRLEEGRFREDLFFRLTHRVEIPPLRERLEDLPLLVDHFAKQQAEAHGKEKPQTPRQLIALLRTYGFPGNVRELKNMVDEALSRSELGTLSLSYFTEYIRESSGRLGQTNGHAGATGTAVPRVSGEIHTLRESESLLIAEALRRTNGNQKAAARLLGLSPSALSRRLSRRKPEE